jgi:hypothetical protein
MFGRLAAVDRYQNALIHVGLQELARMASPAVGLDCLRSKRRSVNLAVDDDAFLPTVYSAGPGLNIGSVTAGRNPSEV